MDTIIDLFEENDENLIEQYLSDIDSDKLSGLIDNIINSDNSLLYQQRLKYLIKYVKNNDLKSCLRDALADELCTGFDNMYKHYVIGIPICIEFKNIELLKMYIVYLERDLELCEIKMGTRIEDDVDVDDIDEFDPELYNEMKIVYKDSDEILSKLQHCDEEND